MQIAQVTVWLGRSTYTRYFLGENLTTERVIKRLTYRENSGVEQGFNFHDRTGLEIVISDVTDVLFTHEGVNHA